MTLYHVTPTDEGVQPTPILKPTTARVPVTFDEFIKTSITITGTDNDLKSVLIDFAAKLADHGTDGSIRAELLQLIEISRYRGVYQADTYAVGDEIKSTDNHYYVRLRAGTDAPGTAAPTATTVDWRKVANGSLEAEIIEFHEQEISSRNSEPDLNDLPDAVNYPDGVIIYLNGQWKQRATTHSITPNLFEGRIGTFRDADNQYWKGTVSLDSPFGFPKTGSWESNPDGEITAIIAGFDNTQYLIIEQAAYEAAKGSAAANDDQLWLLMTRGDGTGGETVALSYAETVQNQVRFQAKPAGRRFLATLLNGNSFNFKVDSDNSGTAFLTHDVGTPHWVDWEPDDVLDLRERLSSAIAELQQEIANLKNRVPAPTESGAVSPTRFRALVSEDLRRVTAKYFQVYTGTNYLCPTSSAGDGHQISIDNAGRIGPWTPVYPNTPDAFDNARPNLLYDGGTNLRQFNSSGVDFNNSNAGSTIKRIRGTLTIKPSTANAYADSDTVAIKIENYGRLTTSVTDHTFHLSFEKWPDLVLPFDIEYSDSPRAGEVDVIAFKAISNRTDLRFDYEFKYSLPFTGAQIPEQQYDQPGTSGHVALSDLSAAEKTEIIPVELTSKLTGSQARIAAWEIKSGQTNHEGKNDPTEEDKSDSKRSALGSHGNVFLEAQQDLRELKFSIRQQAAVATGSSYNVYLCTYKKDVLRPTVVATTQLFSGPPQWNMHADLKGILEAQRFYILSNHIIGDALLKWNAALLTTQDRYVVAPGYLDTRTFAKNAGSVSSVTLHGLGSSHRLIESITLYTNNRTVVLPTPGGIENAAEYILSDHLSASHNNLYVQAIFAGGNIRLDFIGHTINLNVEQAFNITIARVDVSYRTGIGE